MPEVPQHILDERARTGIDRWDEMWEGVLHIPPVPNREHQDLTAALLIWLRSYWAASGERRAHLEVNVASPGGWPNDYRIPDLVLIMADRFDIDHNEYFEGAPTVVVEIRSPGDETFEKMPFYAKLDVPECWVIDRDSKRPELNVLRDGEYQPQGPDPDGWLHSAATGISLRGEGDGKLLVRLVEDPSTEQVLPNG